MNKDPDETDKRHIAYAIRMFVLLQDEDLVVCALQIRGLSREQAIHYMKTAKATFEEEK